MEEEFYKSFSNLSTQLTDLTLSLQKEVAELKEYTVVNKALQNEAIEQIKREILNVKKSPAKNTGFNFGIVFNAISVISFVLIIAICFKCKLFFG